MDLYVVIGEIFVHLSRQIVDIKCTYKVNIKIIIKKYKINYC